MTIEPAELFPVEFRRATVQKVVRGLVDGSLMLTIDTPPPFMKHVTDPKIASDAGEVIGKAWADLIVGVNEYCSGNHQGKDLDKVESKIFWAYAQLRVYQAIKEEYSPNQMEQDIAKFNARIDSTNNLLLEVLKVNKRIVEILESIDNP
jgi:hypothetical protein